LGFGVGVGVVAVVFVDPPAVAQPEGKVGEQQAGQVVGPLGPEDLPVPGVVTEEPELGEHHGQQRGDRELPPRVAQHDEQGPGRHEQATGHGDLRQVVAGPALQQAGGPDLAHQLGEVAAAAGRGVAVSSRAGKCCCHCPTSGCAS